VGVGVGVGVLGGGEVELDGAAPEPPPPPHAVKNRTHAKPDANRLFMISLARDCNCGLATAYESRGLT
jgi:hypothetical protein